MGKFNCSLDCKELSGGYHSLPEEWGSRLCVAKEEEMLLLSLCCFATPASVVMLDDGSRGLLSC